jgi:tripartite-type tricarboxylate transporter receptor subunit TctC
MENTFGIKVKHVPYNEGIGPAIAALVGGHVDAVISTPGTAKAQVDAGVLRILGIMDTQRCSLTPDVPTFKEALGLNFDFMSEHGLYFVAQPNCRKTLQISLLLLLEQ